MTHFKRDPFSVVNGNSSANGENTLNGEYIITSEMEAEFKNLDEKIKHLVECSPIVLFMKGNAQRPQCGFSANTVKILNTFGKNYVTYDILKDPEVRQGIKEYSQWPTFPQLYIQGELVGGNDIVTQMFEEGELQSLLEKIPS
jgi:monothiol glutaredoxin